MKKKIEDLFNKSDSSEALRDSLFASIKEFTESEEAMGTLLETIFEDVERAAGEELEIFPVTHHSPSSARFMIKRLIQKKPDVIFMELCEDLLPLLEELRQCTFPVALQAFALETSGFPERWTPLSVVAPLTEFSAEHQAITYALETGTPLVFVDRSCDHVFQWLPQEADDLEKEIRPDDSSESEIADEDADKDIHGSSIGIQIGNTYPGFREFEESLLKNANVHHYSEWWEKYIEEALVGEECQTYYQLLYFIGSLHRRLRQDNRRYQVDCDRERYMWQRMKEYVAEHDVNPANCIYICGAFHAVSDIEEFGIKNEKQYEISNRTDTKWLYGIIPSSYYAIEYQFGLPAGTVSLAEKNWKKSLAREKLNPFRLSKKPKALKLSAIADESFDDSGVAKLVSFMGKVPNEHAIDVKQLTEWCAGIVNMARKNGYLATTADSIAIFQTAIMLANMRNRPHPSPYDFKEAAITCLEKDSVPKKRNIAQICTILLGGDKMGQVGYLSMPPLAQDVYDRLAPLNKNLTSKTIQRALIDFKKNPELKGCSDLLWKLQFLTGNTIVRPIMGERSLGFEPIQESWDILIGKHQRIIIEIGYEGITVEYVIEKRLKRAVYSADASAAKGLDAVEKCILFLGNARLVEELGERSVSLISKEDSISEAPEIFRKIRNLIHYYRSEGKELPHWLNDFIITGYSHYCTMLPKSFIDEDVSPHQVSAMTGFVLTLESLALSLGCSREQFIIAIRQSSPETPEKQALLWTAELLLSLKEIEEIRSFFDALLDNPMRLQTFPDYLKGFVMALDFTSSTVSLIIELFSKALERLPDSVLLPWLPLLITTLQKENPDLMARIIKEASLLLPGSLSELKQWTPDWYRSTETVEQTAVQTRELSGDEAVVRSLLKEHSDTLLAMAERLSLEMEISPAVPVAAVKGALTSDEAIVNALIIEFDETLNVVAELV